MTDGTRRVGNSSMGRCGGELSDDLKQIICLHYIAACGCCLEKDFFGSTFLLESPFRNIESREAGHSAH